MIDAEKRAFTAHQQVRIQTKVSSPVYNVYMYAYIQHVCVLLGAVDGGEAESSRQSVRRLRGASVSAVPGAAGLGAGEGGRHRSARAAAGGAGRSHGGVHQSNRCRASGSFLFLLYFKVQKNVEDDTVCSQSS